MSLTADQVVLLAAVAQRPRTPRELAVSLANDELTASMVEQQLRTLRALELVSARMDKCPLCEHVFGGRLYAATERGMLLLADSPLVRKAIA